MEEAVVGLMVAVPLLGLAGGILILLMSMYQRTKTLEMRHEALPVDLSRVGRRGAVMGEVDEGRQDVDEGDRVRNPPRREPTGRGHEKRHAA